MLPRSIALGVCSLLVAASTALVSTASGHVEQRGPADRIRMLSVDAQGRPGDADSYGPEVSRDGRLVAYTSDATNLGPRPRTLSYDRVFLLDRRTGRTVLAARDRRGHPARDSSSPSLSPNGRYLAFCSNDATLVRPDREDLSAGGLYDPDTDVFVRDLRSGELRRVSSDRRGGMADGYSCLPRVADNGDVVFYSWATDLVGHDGNEKPDIFLYDWGGMRARRLARADIASTSFDLAGDGSVVALAAVEPLVERDTNGTIDVYTYRRTGGGLHGTWEPLLFRADGSAPPNGCAAWPGISVSGTGRFVTAGCFDGAVVDPPIADKLTHLWLRDRRTGRLSLLNPTDGIDSEVLSAATSDDGRTVLFGARGYGFGGTAYDEQYNLYLWRRGDGIRALTPGPELSQDNNGPELSGDGRYVVFSSFDAAMVGEPDPLGEVDTQVFGLRLR